MLVWMCCLAGFAHGSTVGIGDMMREALHAQLLEGKFGARIAEHGILSAG